MQASAAIVKAVVGIAILAAFAMQAQPAQPVNPGFKCHMVPPLSADISADDSAAQDAFCAIDVTSTSVAMCAKNWSTSPAALIYDLEHTPWEGRAVEFEAQVCAIGGRARDQSHAELAMFKNSLNGRETSGTFAPSSVLYYHFSRLLQTRLQVPVAVLAEFPRENYLQRVVLPGVKNSESKRLKMLHAGWQYMDRALSDPGNYPHGRELLTDNSNYLWGVFLLQAGHRYGPEVNGTRESGWGEGQNRDFQRTAPFLALREDLPLASAIKAGIALAREDEKMAEALSSTVPIQQIAWWMNDITEMVILDSLLGQQDRIGNIDYQWRWLWWDQGTLRTGKQRPDNQAAGKLRITVLNDNDAGVRSGYVNYARRTGMLDGWHHIDPGLYRRVQALAADFGDSGPVASAVLGNYRLSSREARGIIRRGIEIADQLRERCESGALRFDLSLTNVMNPGAAEVKPASCSRGL